MKKDGMSTKKRMRREEAADYIEELLRALRAGEVEMDRDGQRILLKPDPEVTVKVELTKKRFKEKLSLSISWPAKDVARRSIPSVGAAQSSIQTLDHWQLGSE
jgi:amphi-Trp domain-containing protein